MINSRKQAGSAFVVIIIVLAVVILGGLGFVLWQNFVQNKDTEAATSEVVTVSEVETENKLTYKNESIGIEFTYPKEWLKIECDDTYISDPQNRVYFGTNEEGLAIVDGESTQLCGGGSDFPPQMTFAIADEAGSYGESSSDVVVDGKTAKKYTIVSGADSIQPGLEMTLYTVDMSNGKHAIFAYYRFPELTDGPRDNTEASHQTFIEVVEESLRFL